VTGRDHYEKRGPQEREVMRIIGDLEEEEEKEEETRGGGGGRGEKEQEKE
jgi:hypothetical protein